MSFASLLLMFLDAHDRFGEKAKFWLEFVTYPVQYLANLPSEVLDNTLFVLTSQKKLLQENQTLKTELILLKLQQQRFLDLENENRQLRALLNAAKSLPLHIKVAEVLFVAGGANAREWIINQGRKDGVFVGQVVLDAEGIVGQIVHVGPENSRVMLLNDPKSSIPVESVKTGLRSILQGNGVARSLALKFIPKTANIIPGELLVSSGLGGYFPKGYPVGKISTTQDEAGDEFMTVNVAPVAQLEHQRFVLLLWNDHA